MRILCISASAFSGVLAACWILGAAAVGAAGTGLVPFDDEALVLRSAFRTPTAGEPAPGRRAA